MIVIARIMARGFTVREVEIDEQAVVRLLKIFAEAVRQVVRPDTAPSGARPESTLKSQEEESRPRPWDGTR